MVTRPAIELLSLDEILAALDDGVFAVDRDRKCIFFSDGCERITGYDRNTVVGSSCRCHDITQCTDEFGRSLAGVLCPLPDLMDGTRSAARQRMQISRRDGKIVWVDTNYTPIRDASGTTVAVVGVMRNVTEDVQRNRELRGVVEQHSDMNQNHTTSDAGESSSHSPDDVNLGGKTPVEGSLDHVLTTIERREIVSALRRAKGQRTEAARRLGISRSRLYRRMEALDIDPRMIETGEDE